MMTSVLLLPKSHWTEARPHTAAVSGAAEFVLSGVSRGEYRLMVSNLPAGAYLESVKLSGQQLSQPALIIGDTPLSGLELRVAADSATLAGVIETDDGQPGVVALLPAETPWKYRVAATEQFRDNGDFRFDSVPPGSYELYALPGQDAYDIYDPAVRKSLERYARTEGARYDLGVGEGQGGSHVASGPAPRRSR